MSKLKIYADGGCRGNQSDNNIGAYGFIILDENDNVMHKEAKAFKNTTNNKMELLGVIKAIEYINSTYNNSSFILEIYSDSSYVCDAFNKGWINGWIKNNWLTAKKQLVKNKDLWSQLLSCSKQHSLNFKWIKGHAGNDYNEMCDNLLNVAMNEYKDISKDMPKPLDISKLPNPKSLDIKKDIDILNYLKDIRSGIDMLIDYLEK